MSDMAILVMNPCDLYNITTWLEERRGRNYREIFALYEYAHTYTDLCIRVKNKNIYIMKI